MPIDLREILEPARTAVLVIECQEGIVGEGSSLPELARSVREAALLERLSGLLACARRAGARVFHCTVDGRADGLGQLAHTPLAARMRRAGSSRGRDTGGGAIASELSPEPQDTVASRDHGLTAFHETGLDLLLRSAGVGTVVITGVSVNIAITGATIEAVNRGYTVVIPTDCVAGVPPAYAQDALRYTLRNLAFLSTAPQICEAWGVSLGA
jgi:nicotinamidase-related amidase